MIKAITYFQWNDASKDVKIISIPIDLMVSVAQGRGDYQFKKVYALGAVGDDKQNILLLRDTFEKEFALPVDRYVVYDDQLLELLTTEPKIDLQTEAPLNQQIESIFAAKTWGYFRGFPGVWRIFSFKKPLVEVIQTNLKTTEYLQILSILVDLNEEHVFHYNVPQEAMITVKEDGQDLIRIQEIPWDYYAKTNLYDHDVRQERYKINIYNGTKTPQIAAKASRTISNIGMEVIDLGNDVELQTTKILVDTKYQKSATLMKLKEIFGAEVEIVDINPVERVEFKIIIGNDWKKRMFGEEINE